MSIEIHSDCRSRLIACLAEALPNIEVQNNMFLNYRSLSYLSDLDNILPTNVQFRGDLEKFISERPLSEFISERISSYLLENQKYDEDTSLDKLINIEKYQDSAKAADTLITEFESLPWQYNIFVHLPFEISSNLKPAINSPRFDISDELCIVSPDDSEVQQLPPPKLHSLALPFLGQGGIESEWSENLLYIKYKTEGYIGPYAETFPAENFKFLVRALCGIGLSLRLFESRSAYFGSTPATSIIIYEKKADDWKAKKAIPFSADFNPEYESLGIWDVWLKKPSEPERNEIIKSLLSDLSIAFKASKDKNTLLRAAQWYYDCHCGQNDLFSFIQATVVLEILLGDKAISDIMGLGELLRNRCAYLIGKSRDQRDEILEDFKRIYATRSQIVHRGKNRLSVSEKTDFQKLMWLCLRAIQEEIKLLKADKDKPGGST